jgi:hypothetical protein
MVVGAAALLEEGRAWTFALAGVRKRDQLPSDDLDQQGMHKRFFEVLIFIYGF